jgi:type II secretory pathway pseudopilin PulG
VRTSASEDEHGEALEAFDRFDACRARACQARAAVDCLRAAARVFRTVRQEHGERDDLFRRRFGRALDEALGDLDALECTPRSNSAGDSMSQGTRENKPARSAKP